MNDLVNEIKDRSRLLDVAVSECKKRGMKYAETERDYRVALATKISRSVNLDKAFFNAS